MGVSTVYAHPNPNSFCHAALERFTAGLNDAGHTSEVIDLYASRFDPIFGAREEKVTRAEGLAFIAPVFWLGFPAILKGWVERVFAYGFAYYLTPEGWRGDLGRRVPLLYHEKTSIIGTTFFKEDDHREAGLREPMTAVIDDLGLRYPGVREVEHVYLYAVPGVDDDTRRSYLERAYRLGKEYAG